MGSLAIAKPVRPSCGSGAPDYLVTDIEVGTVLVDGVLEVAANTPVLRFSENSPMVLAVPFPTNT